MYLARIPRRIIVDMLGEWTEDADAEAFTINEAVDAIRHLAARQPRWTVTLALEPEAIAELVDWMIPLPQLQTSPIVALGGAALLIDEADLIAGPRNYSTAIRTLYRRSRHVGLTLISATQRPANVSREASAMSTQALMMSLSEPRDLKYMVDLIQLSPQLVDRYQRWIRKHRHGGLWWHRPSNRFALVPDAGSLLRVQNHPDGVSDDGPVAPLPVPPIRHLTQHPLEPERMQLDDPHST